MTLSLPKLSRLLGLAALAGLSALALAPRAGAQTLPVANAGPDQDIPCAPAAGAQVVLDGTASFDPDNPLAVLTYSWTSDEALGVGVIVDGAMPTVTLLPGVHTLTLTVDDGVDGTATDTVMVTVVADTEPPTLVLKTDAMELWPPNHKLHQINPADVVESVSDTCDTGLSAANVVFTDGTSDEAEDGTGDGSTLQDIAFGEGCSSAFVRAERAGNQDGRVYHLTLSVQDAAGLSSQAVLTVSVPHDRGKKGPAVDSGVAYEVTGDSCGPLDMCPPAPADACDDAGQASVSLHAGAKGSSLRWKARGFSATEGDFAAGTDYQLCVYTDTGTTAVLADDPAAPASGWKHGKAGAHFQGRRGGPHAGLSSASLGAKKGAGALKVGASGDDLSLPSLPLAQGSTLTLQLVGSDGTCVGSDFDSPSVNDADELEAETN